MKRKNIYEIFILINFFLTILFMVMHNMLGFITSGIVFLCISRIKSINSTNNYINKMKEKYNNYKIGSFNIKLKNMEINFGNFIITLTGLSLILCYVYYLLSKYAIISQAIVFGLLIPLNISLFSILVGVHFIIIGIRKQTHLKNYTIKVLAECIKVDESVYNTEIDNFNFRESFYIVTYKYSYDNEDYVVSANEPRYYKHIPVQGGSYYIYINKNDFADFTDNLNDYKNDIIFGFLFLLISIFMIMILLYIFIIGNR